MIDANNGAASAQRPPQRKTVRIISPHSSTSDDEDDKDKPGGIRRDRSSPVPLWREGNQSPTPEPVDTDDSGEDGPPEDPFQAEFEAEEEAAGEALPDSSKARTTLGLSSKAPGQVEQFPSYEESNVNRPGSPQYISDKARSTLGMPLNSSKGSYERITKAYERNNPEDGVEDRSDKSAMTRAVAEKAQRTLGMPSNPFSKTPHSSESFDNPVPVKEFKQGPQPKEPSVSRTKTPMDVDAFTRLLLTGDKGSPVTSTASTPSAITLPLHGTLGDNSSNTDTSSLSRQSILEPPAEVHPETPRTSHDLSSDDEERRRFSAGSTSSQRPDVPRTRHGEPLKKSSPQNNTFSSSEASRVNRTLPSKSSSSSPRTPTDLNKPLPPSPASTSAEYQAAVLDMALSGEQAPSSEPQKASSKEKRNAPPPPLARRQSQLRSKYAATPSDREPAIEEEKAGKPQIRPLSQSFGKAPAPPPPRRRGGDRSSMSIQTLPASENVQLDQTSLKSPTTKPKPPPSRRSSVQSVKRPDHSSSTPNASATGPPLPPPRRRGSSASSFSTRASTGEQGGSSTRGQITESVASSSQSLVEPSVGEEEERREEKDLLADLTALQRDVDALRGKFG